VFCVIVAKVDVLRQFATAKRAVCGIVYAAAKRLRCAVIEGWLGLGLE
jgi:hypothetical protein